MICNIGQTNATSYSDCTITVMCHNSSIVVLIMLSKRHHCSGRTLTVKCITLNAICIVYLHCSWFHSCLLVASFYLLHYNVFGLFQPIKAKCKQTWVKATAMKKHIQHPIKYLSRHFQVGSFWWQLGRVDGNGTQQWMWWEVYKRQEKRWQEARSFTWEAGTRTDKE